MKQFRYGKREMNLRVEYCRPILGLRGVAAKKSRALKIGKEGLPKCFRGIPWAFF
jgi:hypothetical protein